jgi:hypothetical protein
VTKTFNNTGKTNRQQRRGGGGRFVFCFSISFCCLVFLA